MIGRAYLGLNALVMGLLYFELAAALIGVVLFARQPNPAIR